MMPSAITDFRIGLEKRLPHAQVQARPISDDWTIDIEGHGRHATVEWSQETGFVIEGHEVRNVDIALSETARCFEASRA